MTQPQDVVQIAIRHGDDIKTVNALVLSVDPRAGLAGENGQPAIEVVYVDPDKLRHAGTSDWHLALKREINVLHRSHENVTSGKTIIAYRHEDEDAKDEAPALTATPEPTPDPTSPPKTQKKALKETPPDVGYTITVDGKQKGPLLTAAANIKLLDGSIVSVADLKAGDALEEGITVESVTPSENGAVIGIVAVHKQPVAN